MNRVSIFVILSLFVTATVISAEKVSVQYEAGYPMWVEDVEYDPTLLLEIVGNCTNAAKTPIYIQGLSASDKQLILDLHNKYRNITAAGGTPSSPPAQNMLELIWDDLLEVGAQKWANNCTFAHNTGAERKANTPYWWVGQNLCIGNSASYVAANFTKLYSFWYDEYKYYNASFPLPVTNYTFFDPTGHYTQAVWANSQAIGCGYVTYKDTKYHNYLVCHYGPGGNVIKAPIYINGTFDGTLCPYGISTKWSKLCAPWPNTL